jgi:hypothetical protein
MCVSQITGGRKNQITFEISGSKAAIAWDSEHPNVLWLGYGRKANELLIRDPSLLLLVLVRLPVTLGAQRGYRGKGMNSYLYLISYHQPVRFWFQYLCAMRY